MGGGGVPQHVFEIASVIAATDKAVAPIQALRLKPAQQVIRRVRKGAHALGAHVQPVRRIVGVIGRPAREPRPPFDQDHPQRVRSGQQMHRRHHAAEAGADHGHRRHVVIVLHDRPSASPPRF